jgi:multicomponent Na+:H+ antiporter subunit G
MGLAAISETASLLLLGTGLVFWFWGTWPLLETSSYARKLHALSVADTLGSALMLLGLLLRIPRQWPLLTLGLLALMLWNTIFGYVLATCSQSRRRPTGLSRNPQEEPQ